MKQLQLNFKTSEGKNKILMVNYFKDDLNEEQIKSAMQDIAKSKIFVKDDTELYHEAIGAKYITRTEETIFEEIEPS